MNFHEFEREKIFRGIWDSVSIARPVPYTLFTFGDSDLEYYLIVDSEQPHQPVEVSRGVVKVARPVLITPENSHPEFRNFFEDNEFGGMVDFLMSRTAAFSNLQIENHKQKAELLSDSVEEIVARLNKTLDDQDEDRIAILTAPYRLGGVAVLKYATDRIMESAAGNIQEFREKGFLP
ncbi:hypothetical protein [Thalassoglobus sp.]|uniref:hypothetical protein n=1 Tax=Thalassoglobus sp. TaxID=2795869 RepID=UPI003AA9A7F6